MLKLKRKVGQDIVFPELGIHIRMLHTKTTAELAIQAPRDIKVVRGELLYPKGENPELDGERK